MSRIRLWQWANILALDTMLIAFLWQSLFATILELRLSIASRIVLGISVWLAYTADRLFDVMPRSFEQLRSARHCFAKRNLQMLWMLWACLLIINIVTAFKGLTNQQLQNGMMLLALCLLYTELNHRLSSRFFPKEFCVAIIYVYGIIVLLMPDSRLWLPSGALVLLCLINCLIIGIKERPIDVALQVNSMAQFNPLLTIPLYFSCLIFCYFLDQPWLLPIGASLMTLLIVHKSMHRLSIESFRVLADGALLVGPLIAFFLLNGS